MHHYHVLIIGGGPAGLFCALNCKRKGMKVAMLEKNETCGRNLLITGSGQCNITHAGEIAAFFSHYGDNGAFLKPALMSFTNRDLMDFFRARGLEMTIDPGGKVFPESGRSMDALEVLLTECRAVGVDFHCSEPARKVEIRDDHFVITSQRERYRADFLVLATGGASYPATGSTGDGYMFARNCGHSIIPYAPALAPVYVRDYPFGDLAGISFDKLSLLLFRNDRKIRSHQGDILLTHTGLSGPGVLDFSRYIEQGDILTVCFLPGANCDACRRSLTDAFTSSGIRQVKTVLSEYPLPERFVKRILVLTGIPADLSCAHLSRDARNRLISALTGYRFRVEGVGGFTEAMVTRGGITLKEVNPKTMESRIARGLYCIGEVLDIDGDSGGYNLQAAFSTAMCAARHILSRDWDQHDFTAR